MKKHIISVCLLLVFAVLFSVTGCKKITDPGESPKSITSEKSNSKDSSYSDNANNSNSQAQSFSSENNSPVFDPIINDDGTRDFSNGEQIGQNDNNWQGANGEQNSLGADKSVTFTYDNRAIGEVLVGKANESLSSPFAQITNQTMDCEYVYSMKVKANAPFTFILFADNNTKETYTAQDINKGVAPKMGVYFTFENGKIAVKAALGNGTAQYNAISDVCLNSVDGAVALDSNTETNLRISLTRYSFDNIMIQIYIDNKLVSFKKIVPKNNEDVYGLSLRSAWLGGVNGDGYSIGVNGENMNSPFIRVSRGLSNTDGLGKGLAIIPSNTQSAFVTVSNFTVIKMS